MKSRSVLKAATMGALLLAAGAASAAPPPPFDGNCDKYDSSAYPLFRNVCDANAALMADGYENSCAGGGNCASSVDNKLWDALAKHIASKDADARTKICAIKSNAEIWASSKKPNLDPYRLSVLVDPVQALASDLGGACP